MRLANLTRSLFSIDVVPRTFRRKLVIRHSALLALLWVSHGRTSDFAWFAVMAMFFYGAMAVLPVLVAEIFPVELRATALGACASAPLSLGFALFPLIVPFVVAKAGWVWAFSAVVTPALLGAALVALLLPSLRSSEVH